MRLPGFESHLGARVSALVDAQLSPVDEDRAWDHVLGCASCRRLVERERWLKTRLSMAAPAVTPGPRQALLGALYDVDAWAAVDDLERSHRGRRTALVAAGAGSVGFAVAGLLMVTSAPAGIGEAPRPAPASVRTGLPTVGPPTSPEPSRSPSRVPASLGHRAR